MNGKMDRIRELNARYPEPWEITKEPHNYKDGTDHFTHVSFKRKLGDQDITVQVASYLTPDLAELLILLKNEADRITNDAQQ